MDDIASRIVEKKASDPTLEIVNNAIIEAIIDEIQLREGANANRGRYKSLSFAQRHLK